MNGALLENDCKTYEKCIKNNCKGQIIHEEALSTFLTEVESIINSHPIKPASEYIDDLEQITSNHLLLGRPSPSYKPCNTN